MKRCAFFFAIVLAAGHTSAQVNVQEPEFVGNFCILTSDESFDALPKENGEIQKHQNKVSKFAKLVGGISRIAGAAGVLGVTTAGSATGVVNGIKVMSAAQGVASAADAANVLAGVEGMDIVFKGGSSTYRVPSMKDIRLLIKGENNDLDPMDCYRIVRFVKSKKDRRIQWMQIEPSLIGSENAQKAGYVTFEGHKYGEQSYILTIPASEVRSGEYGIFFMSLITVTAVPVATFSVK